jgi:hypothetical protein
MIGPDPHAGLSEPRRMNLPVFSVPGDNMHVLNLSNLGSALIRKLKLSANMEYPSLGTKRCS